MPKLLPLLFKEHPKPINNIRPLVPALWTGDPAASGLNNIVRCFPEPDAVRSRIRDLIALLSTKEGLECSNGKGLRNPKPLEDLISLKSAQVNCELVRDYNGEYAPCVAAVLGGGQCRIVPARKPSSMKATIAEVDKPPSVSLKGCPEGDAKADAEATVWLEKKIRGSNIAEGYHKAELVKQNALGERLFQAAALKFTTKVVANPTSMNSLHQYWTQNEIPQRFFSTVSGWKAEEEDAEAQRSTWARSIRTEAPKIERKASEKKKLSVPVVSTATVEQPETIVFALWLRWQLPKDHSHNMGQDLLTEIVMAISHVCQAVYPADTKYVFALFGDRAAKKTAEAKGPEEIKFGDYPIHKAQAQQGKANPASGSTVPEFIAKTFLDEWKGDQPSLTVTDFRDLYNPKYFKTPLLEDYDHVVGPGKPVEVLKGLAEYREKHARKAGYSYWEQYAFFHQMDTVAHPRFIIGAESGNMDGFGYCGIPVVSVDVEDDAAVDESILTDRIGQYCLLTPLWNLLNYRRGKDLPTFRRHLYGTILMYTQYVGQLHETKVATDVPISEKPKFVKNEHKLVTLFESDAIETDVIEQSLKAQYDVVDVEGDGNCLFRALSRARTLTEDRHALYRQQAVRYAYLFFEEAMLQAGSGCDDADIYKRTMESPAVGAGDVAQYGGFVEIEAFALRESVTIEVYSEISPVITANPNCAETVRILYVNRNHYKAIVPKGR